MKGLKTKKAESSPLEPFYLQRGFFFFKPLFVLYPDETSSFTF